MLCCVLGSRRPSSLLFKYREASMLQVLKRPPETPLFCHGSVLTGVDIHVQKTSALEGPSCADALSLIQHKGPKHLDSAK